MKMHTLECYIDIDRTGNFVIDILRGSRKKLYI